ncbi:MAG: hypothetical protein LBL84_00060 [Candidatus Nomurabacteria bacterium]|jgi:polyhydroxyalkanoate synthesis regulator phasin|nr:hypothetical protein [Candidatus Nomurabacteria bacterium]
MTLDNEDKQWIKNVVVEIRDELTGVVHEVETNLRDELTGVIREVEYNLRGEIREVSNRLDTLEKEVYRLNENRMQDEEAAFSDVAKCMTEIKKLKKDVAQLKMQIA